MSAQDTNSNPNSGPDRIRSIFNQVIDLPPTERAAALGRLCVTNGEPNLALRAELDALLASHDAAAAGGFMSSPTAATTIRNAAITETPGTRIGPYKLLQVIGEGGFGTVFLAEQTEPVRRRVALKIIKLGMDTKQVIARFEAERQALALMDHPHIARVLDAGATPITEHGGGRPYFVMEYVVGDAITQFAANNNLDIRARLELFAQVCSAVQHAHTKGIIHRDIKPGNVLVTMTDGKPFARVIDFGIAKATSSVGGLTDKTLFTEHRQLIGTPEYMSPEQAQGSPDIDTRTDVYALGVLLYELLAGDTPFDGKRLRSAAWDEMRRIIKEEDPPTPSARVTQRMKTGGPPSSPSAPLPLRPSAPSDLRGELDWIVMKSLDKDRARRYETPSALAADVLRHLQGEAVQAAPPSAAYRLKKFASRNKGPVIAGTTAALAILAGTAIAFVGWREASALARAQQQDQERAAAKVAAAFSQIFNTDVPWHMKPQPGLWMSVATNLDRETRITRAMTPDGPAKVTSVTRGGQEEVPPLSDSLDALSYVSELAISGLNESNKELQNSNEQLRAQTDAAEWSAYTANLALAQAAMDAGNPSEAIKRLAECPPGKRGWEWQVLNGSADTSAYAHQTGGVFGFFPDGSRMLTGASTRGVEIRETATGLVAQRIAEDFGVDRAEVSPDGERVLLSGVDYTKNEYTAAVCDLRTGTIRRTVAFSDSPLTSFINGGAHFVTVDLFSRATSQVRVWDTTSGELCATIDHGVPGYGWGACSAKSHRIAVCTNKGIEVWDAIRRERLFVLDTPSQDFAAIDFSPDAQTLMTLSSLAGMELWRADSGERLHTIPLGDIDLDDINDVSFSSNGSRIVLSGWGTTATVIDVDQGRVLSTVHCQPHEVSFSARLSPDGTRMVTTGGPTPHVWDCATGRYLSSLPGHSRDVESAWFSPDGAWIVTAAHDGALRAWRSDARANPLVLRVPRDPTDAAMKDAFDPTVLTEPRSLNVQDVPGVPGAVSWYGPDGETMIRTERDGCMSVAFSPDGRRLIYTAHASIFEHDLAAPDRSIERVHLDVYGGKIYMGPRLIGPDSSGALWSWGQSVQRWSPGGTGPAWQVTHPAIERFDPITQDEEAPPTLQLAEVSRDGRRVLSMFDQGASWPKSTPGRGRIRPGATLYIYDGDTGKVLLERQIETDLSNRYGAGLSPDGRLAAYVEERDDQATGRVIDTETGELVVALTGTSMHLAERCVFSNDNSRVVLVAESVATLWDLKTGALVARFENRGTESWSAHAQFNRDGSKLLLVVGGTTLLVDAQTGAEIAELAGHSHTITAAKFSPDESRIVTASHDQTLRVWDGHTGRVLAVFRERRPTDGADGDGFAPAGFACAAFSPDGRRLAAGTVDGRVIVFDSASGGQTQINPEEAGSK